MDNVKKSWSCLKSCLITGGIVVPIIVRSRRFIYRRSFMNDDEPSFDLDRLGSNLLILSVITSSFWSFLHISSSVLLMPGASLTFYITL